MNIEYCMVAELSLIVVKILRSEHDVYCFCSDLFKELKYAEVKISNCRLSKRDLTK